MIVRDWLALFAIGALLDFVWGKYIIHAAAHNAKRAAVLSGLIFALGSFATIRYVATPILTVPAVLGAMVGTYFATRRPKVDNVVPLKVLPWRDLQKNQALAKRDVN